MALAAHWGDWLVVKSSIPKALICHSLTRMACTRYLINPGPSVLVKYRMLRVKGLNGLSNNLLCLQLRILQRNQGTRREWRANSPLQLQLYWNDKRLAPLRRVASGLLLLFHLPLDVMTNWQITIWTATCSVYCTLQGLKWVQQLIDLQSEMGNELYSDQMWIMLVAKTTHG